jgi:hypothetical protein
VTDRSPAQAVRLTHEWFERHSGWAPPDDWTLAEWMAEGVCRCPDECAVAPARACEHGLASWWLMLRTLDRHDGRAPIPPERLVPAVERLDPEERPDYVAIVDAHHRALVSDGPGYLDPGSGLFVQTARTLWERGSCCEQGCRHCPFTPR